ncbi:hypothetical protein K2173_010593 [Erythroxylum novogranatense]|uniref:Uncharacterized protein n=1 Tax=Erythroxylum novogranatense TaxID=1862640 RepID=A0AAV8TGE2_9ROSI|nr:hypothetical protein K2173_010593 [Erythroxylum novogranatense]
MISPRKLLKIAKKWQRLAALNRKRISLPRGERNDADPSSRNNITSVAEKGHFVVYTADQIRFMFPMSYLNNQVFRELLAMSEEEFGLPGNGPLTIPCDAVFLEYVVSLIRRKVDKEMEKVLVMSISTSTRCSSSYSHYQGRSNQYLLVPSF